WLTLRNPSHCHTLLLCGGRSLFFRASLEYSIVSSGQAAGISYSFALPSTPRHQRRTTWLKRKVDRSCSGSAKEKSYCCQRIFARGRSKNLPETLCGLSWKDRKR